MNKIIIITIMLVLIGSVFSSAYAWFGSGKTEKIFDESYAKSLSSPNRAKLLIIGHKGEISVIDTKTEKVVVTSKLNNEKRDIDSISWLNDEEFAVKMKEKDKDFAGIYMTKDFEEFKLITNQVQRWFPGFFLYTHQRAYIEDKDNKISVIYKNDDIWETNLSFNHTGCSWSNDGRYLNISNSKSKEQYLIDTEEKTIRKFDKYFSGEWAPTRDVYAFYTGSHGYESQGFELKKMYLFNPQDLSFTEVNLGNMNIYQWSWSPDSRYLLNYNDGFYLIDTYNPTLEPKKIPVDGDVLWQRTAWSKDMKSLLVCYHNPNESIFGFFKPFDFYAVKIDIETGKITKKYIDGLLYGTFLWVDDDVIYYSIDHEKGLYRTKIEW